MQKYEVNQRPRKQLGLSLVSIIMAVGSAYVLTNALEDHSIKGILGGAAGFVCFGGLGIVGVIRLLFQPYLLKVDEYGITDNSALVSLGFIPWEEIADAGLVKFANNNYICVKLVDAERFMESLTPVKKGLMKKNLTKLVYPVWIPVNTAEDKATQIAKTVRGFHAEYVKRHGLPLPETAFAWPTPMVDIRMINLIR